MAELEIDDHKITAAEHEFYRSFVVILEHLKNRAINAELEVKRMRRELNALRDMVEYLGTGSESVPGLGQCNTPSPARKLSDGKLDS